MEAILPRKRGRPKGARNGQRSVSLAPIVDWTPTHEMIIQLHIANWTNKAIAEQFGYHPQRISQILADPRAIATKNKILELLGQKLEEDFANRVVRLQDQALENLKVTIFAPIEAGTRAKIHQDNVSMFLAKGLIPQGNADGPRENKGGTLEPKLAERLISALEGSNKVAELFSNKRDDSKIMEAEVVVED